MMIEAASQKDEVGVLVFQILRTVLSVEVPVASYF